MTNRRIEKAVDDLLDPKPKTRLERLLEYLPALTSFAAFVVLFAGMFWLLWCLFQTGQANKARCNTACVERGYHGGDLAESQCICESREILKEE